MSFAYKTTQQHHHQMISVDQQLVTSEYKPNHTQPDTPYPPTQFIFKPRKHKEKYAAEDYQIDYKALPFVFRFNYSALQRLKLRKTTQTPKLAFEIFQYLKEKLIVRRYSQGGKHPNRMKYEEKVKFLMRAFDHRRNSNLPDPQRKKEKFNRQKQLQFFSRKEVKQHFLTQIKEALIRKKAQNQRRIKQIEDCIQMALTIANKQKDRSWHIFEQRIKRKQLPWTDNMFTDIDQFSKHLYQRFAVNSEQTNNDNKLQNLLKEEIRQQQSEYGEVGSEVDEGQSTLSAKLQNNSTE